MDLNLLATMAMVWRVFAGDSSNLGQSSLERYGLKH